MTSPRTAVLLLLPTLTVHAADGLSFEKPKGWEQREDPAKRFTIFVPPGIPAGQDCAVLAFTPQDFAGSTQEYLDQVVKNASAGNELLGPIQPAVVGPFTAAVFSQRTPQGVSQIVAVHAVKWGNRAQAVLFASTDVAFFNARAPEVQAMLTKVAVPGAAPAAPAPTVALAGMLLPLPPGWTRQDDPSGWIILTPPPELASGEPRVWIGPTRKIEGTHWTTHRAQLKGLIEAAKWPGSYRDPLFMAPGPFIQSSVHSSGDGRVMKLCTAAAGDQMESVLLIMMGPIGYDPFINAVYAILEKTTLKNAPREAPRRPTVVEAYRHVDMKQYLNIDGSIFSGKVKYERMLLLSNGAADLCADHAEGFGGSPEIARIDSGCQNGFYGKWTAEGKTVRLLREAEQAEQVYQRENGSLRVGDVVWAPMPRVDDLKLKGRYAYKSAPGAPFAYNYWVEFTEDGAFKTGGLLTWLAATDMTGRPKPPESASGTYEIRDWTLWFKVGGKVVWSTDFMTLKDDPKDLAIVLIDTYGFTREP